MGRTTEEWEARLGRQVRAERLRLGIDQASLASAANISTPSLSALENGTGSRLGTLVKVVRALGREEWLDGLAPMTEVSPLALLRDKDRGAPRQRAPRQRAPRQRVPRGSPAS